MSWLVAQDRVLATLEVADTWQRRLMGVIGQDSIDGVFMIKPAFSVHTFGVRFDLDVAYCDSDLTVIDVVTMSPNRVGMPRPRARVVFEAPKGSFERWGVGAGDQLEIRE